MILPKTGEILGLVDTEGVRGKLRKRREPRILANKEIPIYCNLFCVDSQLFDVCLRR